MIKYIRFAQFIFTKLIMYIIALRVVVSGGIGIQPNCLIHAFSDSDRSEM